MSESWTKEICRDENCKTVNWICLGDLSDQTAVDPDGYKCRVCGKEWVWDEEIFRSLYGEGSIEELKETQSVWFEDGLERPGE